jgi:ABC-type lipoprotein export system ATPase subunit
MSVLLAAQEVSKIYAMGANSVTALDNVSLEINEGEFVAI